ncbi:hypothetical protein [Streptomyces sp. NBC_00203]|uniref:hypothetical protein n=1 Tax=Streptomyces sp. NBC_00203 TaxID=2975680 RepID=UPI00386639D1
MPPPDALGALGDAFLDGMCLCLIVAAALPLLAALVSAVLLRRPRHTPSAPAAASSAVGPGHPAGADAAHSEARLPSGPGRG